MVALKRFDLQRRVAAQQRLVTSQSRSPAQPSEAGSASLLIRSQPTALPIHDMQQVARPLVVLRRHRWSGRRQSFFHEATSRGPEGGTSGQPNVCCFRHEDIMHPDRDCQNRLDDAFITRCLQLEAFSSPVNARSRRICAARRRWSFRTLRAPLSKCLRVRPVPKTLYHRLRRPAKPGHDGPYGTAIRALPTAERACD